MSDEIEFKEGGIIQKRAQEVLAKAADLLGVIEKEGIMSTIEQGKFGGVTRRKDGGKGLSGVSRKTEKYFNPFVERMLRRE